MAALNVLEWLAVLSIGLGLLLACWAASGRHRDAGDGDDLPPGFG